MKGICTDNRDRVWNRYACNILIALKDPIPDALNRIGNDNILIVSVVSYQHTVYNDEVIHKHTFLQSIQSFSGG